MARITITSAELGTGVLPYSAVYLNGSVWDLATENIPEGIYEGDFIIVTTGASTENDITELEVVFIPPVDIEYSDTLSIDDDTVPPNITFEGKGLYKYDGTQVISVDPSEFNFGQIIINNRKDIILNIKNLKSLDMILDIKTPKGVYVVDPSDPLNLLSDIELTITASSDFDLSFAFMPTEIINCNGSVYITIYRHTTKLYIEQLKCIGRGVYAESFSDLLSGNVNQEYEEFEDEDNSQNQYIDFDGQMIKNDLNGDIFFKNDQDAVMQSIRHLLLSPKIYDSNSINLKDLIFENIDSPFHLSRIAETIEDFIIDSEPRIGNINVGAQIDFNDNEKVNLEVSFTLLSNTGVFYNYPLFIRLR